VSLDPRTAFIRIPDTVAVEKRRLRSGVPLLGRVDVENDLVAVRIHLRMGSRWEGDHEAGFSHLASRLVLKGTERRSAARLAEDIESIGGRLTTSSSKEVSAVALLCARGVLEPCLNLLMEAATQPSFPEGELETERQAALARIRAREDQLLGLAFDVFHELFYGQHPYHKPVLGYEATIKGCRRPDVRAFYDRALSPEQLVAAVVGRVDLDQVAAQLDQGLVLPARDAAEPPAAIPPTPVAGREQVIEREVETAKIVAGWPAPPIGHEDSPAMAVLASVLGGSMDSRLFTELRDRQSLAYEIGALYAGYVGPACLTAYMGTRAEKAMTAKTNLLLEVEKLRADGPTADEVARARSFLAGTRLMARERNAHRASLYATNELLGLGHDYEDRFLAALARVTTADVRRVGERWLDQPSVAIVLPRGLGRVTQASPAAEAARSERAAR
jgi:predicted Zn-dependent peptidase